MKNPPFQLVNESQVDDEIETPLKPQFIIGDVASKSPKPQTVGIIINSLLLIDDGQCYIDLERYVMPPGITGSKSFDQGRAVLVLLHHDKKHDGRLRKIMRSTPTLNERILWDKLARELVKIGFKMRHGRVIGVLDYKKPENDLNDDGQPDIG